MQQTFTLNYTRKHLNQVQDNKVHINNGIYSYNNEQGR